MAVYFDRASFEYLYTTTAPVASAPFTWAAWIKPADVANIQEILCLTDFSSTNDYWSLQLRGNAAGDPIYHNAVDGTGVSAITTSGVTVDTWHHICGVEIASDDRAVLIDGGSKGTNSTGKTPDNIDRFYVGVNYRNIYGLASYYDGAIAEIALWNVALSDEEVAILAKGYSPLLVKPESLVAYYPLLGPASAIYCRELISGNDLTVGNGTIATDHPRIIYPS